ncbi:50S ribosomal protein L6 [Candidatus Dojkabacteria bacterium]|nr:50S ribosomal protein L6 [Candidatus Dojkabacteria bacterium]
MSRIGKNPVKIEEGVEVEVQKGGRFGHLTVKVNGPKGELSEDIRKGIEIKVEDGKVVLERDNDSKQNKSLHGLYRSLIANMIKGVAKGFEKELELVGVGYRAELKGNEVELSLGLSHPVLYKIPEGIQLDVKDKTEIKVSGIDKHLVGQVAAAIRETRKPEPYKGKGIRYKGEQVRRKAGKAAATTE